MKLLLTGANGMLGRDLMARLSPHHQVHPAPRAVLDITDADAVEAAMVRWTPDAIVNAAARTDVDGCETDRDGAFAVNGTGAEVLARAAARHRAAMMHFSTDYVFSGASGRPHAESDPMKPESVYGASKAAGETAVRAHCERHFIVRTAWLYGRHGGNFVHTILRLARERDRLQVVDDQVGNPTWTSEVAGAAQALLSTTDYGTYHAVALGSCSWHELACEALRLRGLDTPVDPVSSDQFPRPAPRPANSALASGNLSALGISLAPWQDALAEYLATHPAV